MRRSSLPWGVACLVVWAVLFEYCDVRLQEVAFPIGVGDFDGGLNLNSFRTEDVKHDLHQTADRVCMRWILSHFVDHVSVDELETMAGKSRGVENLLEFFTRESLARRGIDSDGRRQEGA